MRTAAIAGATGLTGQQVLNRLLDDRTYDAVIAVLRRPTHRTHPRLQEKVVEFDNLKAAKTIPIDVAFCCLGTTIRKAGSKEAFRQVDHGYVLSFARWARAGGARHFLVVSSVAAKLDSASFYLRVKAETERDLEGIGFEWLDIFQPSFLLGTRHEFRPGERIGQLFFEAAQFALVGPLERYRGIPASTLAAAMLNRAAHPGPPGTRRHEWPALNPCQSP